VVNTILKEADLFCPNSVRINFTIYQKKILYAFTYDNQNLRSLEYGDPNEWGDNIRYFSFISKQTAEPFVEKNEWENGENTI